MSAIPRLWPRSSPYPSHPSTHRSIIVLFFQNGQRIRGKRRTFVEFYHRHARVRWPLNFPPTCADPVLTTRPKVMPSRSPLARQQTPRTLHTFEFFSLVRSLLLRFIRSDECLKIPNKQNLNVPKHLVSAMVRYSDIRSGLTLCNDFRTKGVL